MKRINKRTKSRPETRLVGFGLALLLGVFGCDDDGKAEDGGDLDVGVEAGEDIAVDPTTDVVEDAADVEDEEGGRRCIPGTRRCVVQSETPGEDMAEVCNDDSVWELVECGENQLCYGGTCGDVGTCEPWAVESCIGYTRYQGCNPVGTGTGEFLVPSDLTCIENEQGDGDLVPRECLEGQTRCADEQILEACAESGLEWEFATNCFEDDETTLCDQPRLGIASCITLCQYIEKRETYVGCEYWAVDLDNAFEMGSRGIPNDAFHAQFAVAISNPGGTLAAEITIECRGPECREVAIDEVLATGTVQPGDMQVFQLPPAQIEGTMHGFWGYRITSTIPIVAYQFNPLENEGVFSNDASLLFPTSSLGTDYWVMSRRQIAEHLKSTVTVVATQEGETNVTVRMPEWAPDNPIVTLAGSDIPPLGGSEELEWTLQQFEVLNIESNAVGVDLTGTFVFADRPVAVFGGNEAGTAPNTDDCVYRERQDDWVCAYDRDVNCEVTPGVPSIELCGNYWTCCADHLEQQMLPVFAWGREFNAARSFQRLEESDVWRIMAGADHTEITLVGIPSEPGEPTRTSWTGSNALDEGEWIEFESWSDFEILATGPIFVGQFLTGLHNPGPGAPPPDDPMNGDPTFIMAVPREQYRTDYIFLVPAEYAHNFVTIVVPTGLSVTHTDEVGTQTFDAQQFTPFASGRYSLLRIELENEGYQRLVADDCEDQDDDCSFGVTVYGYDDDVSYGYPAGLDIKKINR